MKLWYSFTKELKLASQSFYFYVEVLMAVIILIILLVIMPEKIVTTEKEYLFLDMPEAIKEKIVDELLANDTDGMPQMVELKYDKVKVEVPLYEGEGKKIYLIASEVDLEGLTKSDRPMIGAVLRYDEGNRKIKYEYYLQGYESERLRNLYLVIHSRDIESMIDQASAIEVRQLKGDYEDLNSRESALPALLTFNGSLMGVFVIAAYIFLDKQEGIIKAYAVTSSKVWQYLMSKVLVLMTVTFVTTLSIAIPVIGLKMHYPMMILLLVTSSFFSATLGLLVSSFFDSMTKSFGAIYVIMMAMILPAISYFMPSWNPMWIRFLPSYHLILGFKETMISGGDLAYVAISSLSFLLVGLILFFYANRRFKMNLAR